MNRHALIEQIAAGRARHRALIQTLSRERADAGAELDSARAALSAAQRRLTLAEQGVQALEARVQNSALGLRALEDRSHQQLRETAAPVAEFIREARAELDRLCIELRPATVRSYPTGQSTLDGRQIMETYSENPSRGRRVAAVREAMREAEQLAIEVADLDELELALESLWSAIPAITVEKHDNAA